MSNEYIWSEEAEKLATGLIPEYHPHLQHLKIAYLCKPKKVEAEVEAPVDDTTGLPKRKRGRPRGVKQGKIWIAKASLVGSRFRVILEKDYKFVITINQEIWDTLDLKQQVAVIDHELCHCVVDTDTGKCGLRRHDLEDFRAVVIRHGMYLKDVYEFYEACKRGETKGTPQITREGETQTA